MPIIFDTTQLILLQINIFKALFLSLSKYFHKKQKIIL
jgi:hypothetical protein